MTTSPNNTILTGPGSVITDAAGNTWQIIDGKVAVNGTADPLTANVILLAYENGAVWQENTDRQWWSKTTPADPWSPPFGTAVSPLVCVASPDNSVLVGSVVTGLLPPSIRDVNDDRWTINAAGQVAVNGVADLTTARVIALAYENGRIWQENADRKWWSKASAADSWQPVFGTKQSPIPPGSTSPIVTYLSGTVIDYTNTSSPTGYSVQTVDDGGKTITFDYQGRNVSRGSIDNKEGDLLLDVQGKLINAGTLLTEGSIGSAHTTIDIESGATLRNTGLIATQQGQHGPIVGTVHVIGAGTFRNTGTVMLAGGTNTDFDMSGRIVNAGLLSFEDSFGTTHTLATTGDIVNTGSIADFNVTTIQWGYEGPPHDGAPGATFTNDGTIESFSRSARLTLAAGSFTHNADGSPVHDYHGTLVNNGQITATGGGDVLEIAAPLVQGSQGRVDVMSGAALKLDSTTDGGTITLTAGMLEFGGDRVAFHGPAGASGFHADVVLDGASDTFNFERSDIALTFQATSITSADLLINLTGIGAPEQIADIHLVGDYHASQFVLSGSNVVFTKLA